MPQNFTVRQRKAATPPLTLQKHTESVQTWVFEARPVLCTAFQSRACVTCVFLTVSQRATFGSVSSSTSKHDGKQPRDVCKAPRASMIDKPPHMKKTNKHVTLEHFVVETCQCRRCVLASALHS